MKIKRSRYAIWGGITLVMALLVMTILRPAEEVFFQDARSHAIKAARHRWGLKMGERIIFSGSMYDPERAEWQMGVEQAYRRPLFAGESFYFARNNRSGIVRLDGVLSGRINYAYRLLDGDSETSSSTNGIICVRGECIQWSQRNGRAVYIYADPYWRLAKALLIKVYFPVEFDITNAPTEAKCFPWDISDGEIGR